MAQKCVHKGCGKTFDDPDEPCVYHPGPPVFHEGQKGWQCCKPRVLTFDEFLSIPPCTTGKHSTIDDTPQPPRKPVDETLISQSAPAEANLSLPAAIPRLPTAATPRQTTPAPPEETDADDPALEIPEGAICRRKTCGKTYSKGQDRTSEQCTHHPGFPIFHEGSKGYSCCKRRVLEFDQFLSIEGCCTKNRHLFIGSGKSRAEKANGKEERLDNVRHDFYQTPTQVICSFYLKKIDKERSRVVFADNKTVGLDLVTADGKIYKADVPLFGAIDPERSEFKIMGTKLELTLEKADGAGWPVLKANDRLTGEIIQSGRAGRLN